MINNGNSLKTASGVAIALVTSFTKAREGNKVISKLYDGSYNIQTIGTAQYKAAVTVYAEDRSTMHRINDLEATGTLLSLSYMGEEYTGYIEAAPTWNKVIAGTTYKGSFTFLIEDEQQ